MKTYHKHNTGRYSPALPLLFSGLLLLAIASSTAQSSELHKADLYLVEWQTPLQVPAYPNATEAPRNNNTPEPRHALTVGSGYGLGDSNEQFNRLWLRSFHPDASHYEGEKAGRKLLQLWAKAAWNQLGADRYQTADYLVEHLDASNAYKPRYGKQKNDLDYRLSISEEDLELKLHYSFY